jgi:methylated-DNA-protein-cysteine methyltransferase-like protein
MGSSTPLSTRGLPIPLGRAGFDLLVYELVRMIPEGAVATYGQIAELIPPPPTLDPLAYRRIRARWVGYALGRCPDDVPWQRVINAAGKPSQRLSGGHLPQEQLLRREGVSFTSSGEVDLEHASWRPNYSRVRAALADTARRNMDEFRR